MATEMSNPVLALSLLCIVLAASNLWFIWNRRSPRQDIRSTDSSSADKPSPASTVEIISSVEALSFVQDAAHQLKTPLAVLSARLAAGPDHSDFAGAHRDIAWMSRLIEQLAATARAASVRLPDDGIFDLAEAASMVATALAPLAIYNNRDIELVGAVSTAPVYGNADLAMEALSNLVQNALSHTAPETAVTIEVTRDRVSVGDRGPGVPREDQERIFRRFEQGRRPTEGGTGLGLAIVDDIMRRHGGSVACSERHGGGATFTLTFRPAEDPVA